METAAGKPDGRREARRGAPPENEHLYRRLTEGNSRETAAGKPGAARHLKTNIFTEGLQKEIAWKRPPGSQARRAT